MSHLLDIGILLVTLGLLAGTFVTPVPLSAGDANSAFQQRRKLPIALGSLIRMKSPDGEPSCTVGAVLAKRPPPWLPIFSQDLRQEAIRYALTAGSCGKMDDLVFIDGRERRSIGRVVWHGGSQMDLLLIEIDPMHEHPHVQCHGAGMHSGGNCYVPATDPKWTVNAVSTLITDKSSVRAVEKVAKHDKPEDLGMSGGQTGYSLNTWTKVDWYDRFDLNCRTFEKADAMQAWDVHTPVATQDYGAPIFNSAFELEGILAETVVEYDDHGDPKDVLAVYTILQDFLDAETRYYIPKY